MQINTATNPITFKPIIYVGKLHNAMQKNKFQRSKEDYAER